MKKMFENKKLVVVADDFGFQWNWFCQNVGIKPAAMVSQKSEHVDPKILLQFIEKAKKQEVPVRASFCKRRTN